MFDKVKSSRSSNHGAVTTASWFQLIEAVVWNANIVFDTTVNDTTSTIDSITDVDNNTSWISRRYLGGNIKGCTEEKDITYEKETSTICRQSLEGCPISEFMSRMWQNEESSSHLSILLVRYVFGLDFISSED